MKKYIALVAAAAAFASPAFCAGTMEAYAAPAKASASRSMPETFRNTLMELAEAVKSPSATVESVTAAFNEAAKRLEMLEARISNNPERAYIEFSEYADSDDVELLALLDNAEPNPALQRKLRKDPKAQAAAVRFLNALSSLTDKLSELDELFGDEEDDDEDDDEDDYDY